MTKEEYAVVLDFLPNGYPFDKRPMHVKTPIVQAIGTASFALFELTPKKGIFLQPHEEVYIGPDKRDKIHHIAGRVSMSKLTHTAKAELTHVVKLLVERNQQRFVEFFNKAQPLSTRMHSIELLPGVGKKHMWEIIEERRVEPFKSFADIKTRVKLLSDPEKLVIKRILDELSGNEKHQLFVEREQA
ncbi:MAG: DUF655 domain-containing protein [Candidatus Woesearchaeota archaeon]|nr:MAG: DUF655 domain-containing protein [Candidatus Woesearchaeota archaeon]